MSAARLRLVLALSLLPLAAGPAGARAEHPAVIEARKHRTSSPAHAIWILEEAARREPQDAEVWAEYVDALDGSRFDALADLAVRHALKAQPGNPDLLLARARLLGEGGAIDVLAELATVPGYEQLAPRLAEWTSLGLSFPYPSRRPLDRPTAEGYALWCERLVVVGKLDRAAAVVDEGIAALPPGDEAAAATLLGRKAVVLALQGELDEALAAQRAGGWPQVWLQGAWYGVADVFLAKGRADLAVAAFGDVPPAEPSFRRLLAVAKARERDVNGAVALLKADDREDRLLLVRVYLAAGREEDARAVGDGVAKRKRESFISDTGPWLGQYSGPESLAEEYRLAVRWLHETFPDRREGIAQDWGTGDEPMERYRGGWRLIPSLAEETRALEAELATFEAPPGAGGAGEATARAQLARRYEKAARFDDAAAVLEPLVLGPPGAHAEHHAREWSMLRRRGDADRAAAHDFWSVAAARPLLAAPDARRWNHAKVDRRRPWPTDDEVIAGLTAMGPPVLAEVMTKLGPNTISADDRRPWATVIGAVGAERDVPVLISTMALLVPDLDRRARPKDNENVKVSLAAVDAALEKITGKLPAADAPAERLEFWRSWWVRERERIVRAR